MFNVFSYIPHIPIYVEDFYSIEYLGLTQKFLEKKSNRNYHKFNNKNNVIL